MPDAMLYPQNGDRILTIDSVASLRPGYTQNFIIEGLQSNQKLAQQQTELPCCIIHNVGAVPSLPAIGALGTRPAERGPSIESIYRVSLTDDLCEG